MKTHSFPPSQRVRLVLATGVLSLTYILLPATETNASDPIIKPNSAESAAQTVPPVEDVRSALKDISFGQTTKDIHVSAEGMRIVLWGSVPSDSIKKGILEKAQHAARTFAVVDKLTVQTE